MKVLNDAPAQNKRVIIMRGLPGSGKSTKAQSYGGTIVSADNFFIQDGEYKFDPSKIAQAHATCMRLFDEALRRGDPIVVVDNTNTTQWEYQKYVDKANRAGYTVDFDVVGSGGVDVPTLATRNTHGVPEDKIQKMVQRWEGDPLYPPTEPELGKEAWLKVAKLKPAYSPEELAEKWKVPLKSIVRRLDQGQKVEREHTTSNAEARQIASHHIFEMLEYYDKLEVMEKTASLSNEKAQDIKTKIATVAHRHGFKAYAVGGYVRDLMLGRPPKDLDVVAIGKDDGINSGINLARLVAEEYGLHAPIEYTRFAVAVLNFDGEQVEIVAPRKEFYTPDSRNPDVTEGSLQDDAKRRDFTVNALYQDLETDEIVDPTGKGQQDIKDKIIRVTDYDNPDVIFSEDPLRILRAIRQSYSLGFTMEAKTKEAIQRNVERLPVISLERVRDEFSKILTGPKAGEAIRAMHDIGLTKQFIPELDETFGVTQDSKYHQETVDEHILSAVDLVDNSLASRLVALLHDISKPAKKTVEDGIAHFYNHEDVGAETAQAILERLKFPNDVIDEVVFRVKNHMRPHSNPKAWGDKAVRKFMKDMGQYLDKVLDFAEADINSARREEGLGDTGVEGVKSLRERIEKEKAQGVSPLPTKPLLNGDELKAMFNKTPGAWIGELHKHLADLQLEYPAMTKDEAIAKAKEYMEAKDVKPITPKETPETTSGLHICMPHQCGCGEAHGNELRRTLIIGTAGFNHPSWEGTFYPKDLKENEKLLYFARHLEAVEINATTHIIPRRDVLERWAAQTPAEFTFLFRLIAKRDFEESLELLFKRAIETIGHDRMGAMSIVIPEGRPYAKGDVEKFYCKVPAHAYAFDLKSEAWVCPEAYDEITKCHGTIVRNHLLGGKIDGLWDYMRMPVWTAMREANLGNNLKVFAGAATDVLNTEGNPGEAYVIVKDETGGPDETGTGANVVLQLMKLMQKKKYQPSPIDLSIMPKQFGGPSDMGFGGMNNSQWPSARNNEDPMNAEEEAAVDVKRKRIRNPGKEELTPLTNYPDNVGGGDGLAAPSDAVQHPTN